ncbi:dihydrofolate synthase / folylpolyglutamate synthase [Lactobacillus apis]|uniref:bifunctional folylpolyglutamate synthase/dihydrofolate synthase n=1 Tax=Lactobacillus apis TaxID=303541 RepID=UPI0008160E60|nr:folylpolyglutamate synthase/dihydrofolate synthase family protein [Lactobacillus apis]GGG33571.1 bifunctional folylpolyglutamate synthase/dihydrofolate synthase [Lactobacillus apis]SCB80083.1 dihydrofolate synthase / folylpolyglutamate synthase [Lactobacillus apis]
MFFTNAQDVIKHLYSLPKLHEKADLTYIKRVLKLLGDPQDQVKTIHVTGTNGKGSTSYYLSNLLQKAGQKTGLFVSPYIFEFNERIQLNGQNISDSELVRIANLVENALDQIRIEDPNFALVTFEYEVVAAFVYFEQVKCDYAVIEVGIGGEHDKTNVITPEVSIITTVGLDHEDIIGPTLLDIAREKSGVIKTKRPVVLGNLPKEVMPIIEERAREKSSPIRKLGKDFFVSGDQKIRYRDNKKKLSFNLRPEVEGFDIAVAIQAFSLLHLPLASDEIEDAINQTIIPGRYQVLQSEPLIILDGAHNIQAMQNLLNFIHEQAHLRHGTVRILMMMMHDKDLDEVFSLFQPTDQVELTTIDYPRAAKKKDFPDWVVQKYPYQENWQSTYKQLKLESQSDDILLVTGSFYLVGEVLHLEENAKNEN